MRELQKVLDENEKVLWEGRPQFLPFLMDSRSIAVGLFGIVWTAFLIFVALSNQKMGYWIFILPHFWIGLAMIFGYPLYNLFVFDSMHYAITDKRVLIQKGIIGRDFQSVDFDNITNMEVSVGLFDKLFSRSSGSIWIYTAGTFVRTKGGLAPYPYMLRAIRKPYDTFNLLKKASHDVKTDIYHPNKDRPATNPGYKTAYDRKQVLKKR